MKPNLSSQVQKTRALLDFLNYHSPPSLSLSDSRFLSPSLFPSLWTSLRKSWSQVLNKGLRRPSLEEKLHADHLVTCNAKSKHHVQNSSESAQLIHSIAKLPWPGQSAIQTSTSRHFPSIVVSSGHIQHGIQVSIRWLSSLSSSYSRPTCLSRHTSTLSLSHN